MKNNDTLVRDVVCGMMVDRQLNTIDYLNMHFAFCSQQCMARFQANPHLYIGYPGHKAPKQLGREVIKRRTLSLATPLSSDKAAELIDGLGAMMGIKDVSVKQNKVEITYDLLQATAEQIELKISEVGGRLGEAWAEKLRRAFIHYLEEIEIDSLQELPSSHGRHH